jgi:hypothetical protein
MCHVRTRAAACLSNWHTRDSVTPKSTALRLSRRASEYVSRSPSIIAPRIRSRAKYRNRSRGPL